MPNKKKVIQMAKFRKKPVIIEAWQNIKGNKIPDWLQGNGTGESGGTIIIVMLEGTMTAKPGDWIIKGIEGECYLCKSNIFEKTYESVSE